MSPREQLRLDIIKVAATVVRNHTEIVGVATTLEAWITESETEKTTEPVKPSEVKPAGSKKSKPDNPDVFS